ncbi:MAG TPA: YbaB/EbfC family nucleoid-associated protein [Phenylobacterium sp.]|jgi:hypothetical protein|uniref:YbaB/EbfC family nucleoid-associated protein n=1 Tax=Phenylobacterium sp. TaxID=1871053 RepID=UPI002D428C0A|nr:YbaB/EbfC family nucleoid-associated protein [Phenylobacterium sp.]HZZ70001.1 YbaB/EbfC family nucleoid-associated protein [Phenylobacterium sp.]
MKDLSSLMKQAQAMQEKMGQAQRELEQMVLLGQAGDGMVKLTLRGTGQIAKIDIDESLMVPGGSEMVGDLVAAAHADAKRQLDARSAELMAKAAGPLANMPGMPKF